MLLECGAEYLHCPRGDIRELVRRCDATGLRRLRAFYKGVVVQVSHGDRKGKIEEIIPEAGEYQFDRGAGGGTTTVKVPLFTVAACIPCLTDRFYFKEYFEHHHHIKIRYPQAFGVRIGRSAVYPAEMCTVAPGQVYKKKLEGSDTTKFLNKSTVRPGARIDDIQKAISSNVSGFDLFICIATHGNM